MKREKMWSEGGNYKNDRNTLIARFSLWLGPKTPALEE